MIIGAMLVALSIAVTVTILEELGKEKNKEGSILVNAAVLDNVLGLAVLSATISIVILHTIPSIGSLVFLTAKDIGF